MNQLAITKINNKKILAQRLATIAITCVVAFSATIAYASPITSENVLRLINKERVSRGIAPVSSDENLNFAATLKSRDMLNRNYFEHYAYGLTPWDFIRNAGYDYDVAGENLAMGFDTSEGMVRAWMNSPKHRDNILNPEFSDTGIGIVKGAYKTDKGDVQTTVVTNMFGRKKTILSRTLDFLRNIFTPFR